MSGPSVGFVGLGNMGGPMAARLVEADLEVSVHDLHRADAKPLLDAGASWSSSLTQLATRAEIILLSLPGPPEVEHVVAGRGGLLESLAKGSVIVDLSTNAVGSVRKLAAECARRDIAFLDAPVSGGAPGAINGTLVLMVGGQAAALERVRPVLDVLSRRIVYLGQCGNGTVAKLINNQLYLCGQVLFYEGMVLGAKAGLDPGDLVKILDDTGVGGVHSRLAGRVLDRDQESTTFALSLAEKDVALVLEAGRSLSVSMPVTAAAHELFVAGRAAGQGEKNFWAAFELVEERARIHVPPLKETAEDT